MDRASHLGEVAELLADVDQSQDLSGFARCDIANHGVAAIENLEESEARAALFLINKGRAVISAQNLAEIGENRVPAQ